MNGVATVTVKKYTVDKVVLTPPKASVEVEGVVQFAAKILDAAGKEIPKMTVTWSLADPKAGAIDAKGLFKAGKVAGIFPGGVVAQAGGKKGAADLTVKPGPPIKLSITPQDPRVPPGGKLQFKAALQDKHANPIAGAQVTWTCDVKAGTIDQTGSFTAVSTTGKYPGAVTASAAAGSAGTIKATTSVIVTTNQPPTTPAIDAPQDGAVITALRPSLVVKNATDKEKDPLKYSFELDTVNTFDSPNLSLSGPIVEDSSGKTTWFRRTDLKDNTKYFWRVRASDQLGNSPWALASFTVNKGNDPPTAPVLKSPPEGSIVTSRDPTLELTNAKDPDGDKITYEVQVARDEKFLQLLARVEGLAEDPSGVTSWKVAPPVGKGKTYYWRARATDGKLAGPWMKTATFKTPAGQNQPPGAPNPKSPAEGDKVNAHTPVLTTVSATDPDGDVLFHEFELAIDEKFATVIARTRGVKASGSEARWKVDPPPSKDGQLFWRCRADDQTEVGPWSKVVKFDFKKGAAPEPVAEPSADGGGEGAPDGGGEGGGPGDGGGEGAGPRDGGDGKPATDKVIKPPADKGEEPEGCGCATTDGSAGWGWLLGLMLLGAVGLRRGRRR